MTKVDEQKVDEQKNVNLQNELMKAQKEIILLKKKNKKLKDLIKAQKNVEKHAKSSVYQQILQKQLRKKEKLRKAKKQVPEEDTDEPQPQEIKHSPMPNDHHYIENETQTTYNEREHDEHLSKPATENKNERQHDTAISNYIKSKSIKPIRETIAKILEEHDNQLKELERSFTSIAESSPRKPVNIQIQSPPSAWDETVMSDVQVHTTLKETLDKYNQQNVRTNLKHHPEVIIQNVNIHCYRLNL